MKLASSLVWELDSQHIFVNDVVQWKNNIAVICQTYHRYGFRFLSLCYKDKDEEKVTVHYIEQSHVKLLGRNYKERVL